MKSQWVCNDCYKQECLNIGKELESYSIPNILNSLCNICNDRLGTYYINNKIDVTTITNIEAEAIEFGKSPIEDIVLFLRQQEILMNEIASIYGVPSIYLEPSNILYDENISDKEN